MPDDIQLAAATSQDKTVQAHTETQTHPVVSDPTKLTEDQIKQFEFEMEKFKQLCKIDTIQNVDYSSLENVISCVTFTDLCEKVEAECHLFTQILHNFAQYSEERKLKTGPEKMLRLVHTHGLLHMGSQRSTSFPLSFGIMLISYGCGEGESVIAQKSIWASLNAYKSQI